MKNKYLLEIGVEELPAGLIDGALEQLEENTEKMLAEKRIQFESIDTYATPRRLVILINGLGDKQDTLEEMSRGPAKRIAYDEQGQPSRALEGFMKGNGIEIEDIHIKEYKGEEYVYGKIVKEGRKTEEILLENMVSIIKSIVFPKSMKWGGKDLRFSRPIRWLVSIYNSSIVPLNLEGIEASNITRGHRFLGKAEVEIKSVDEYFDSLEENYVLVDQNKRREIIKYGSDRLAKEKGGNILAEEELLNEVIYLVEYPTPLIGRIKKKYLDLPKDVVITPMKEQLRYFPVVDDMGKLLPYFITVRNGIEEYMETVVRGNEKVLAARLEDAKFFYEDDIENSLEEYVEGLKNVVFQEKLGTLYDKTIRIQELSRKIGDFLGVGEKTQNNLERASYLSKADLTTKMVVEFTELQGSMGMEYAKESGENEIVSTAIYEQYLPRSATDTLPSTTAGSILSIADKLDNIVGYFAIGIQPTASQDPYGIRRQALGVINIILDKRLDLSLKDVVESALYIYVEKNGLVFNYEEIKQEIMEFFQARIKNMLIDKGIRYDIVDAVISTGIDDIYDLKIKADILNEYLNKEALTDLLSTFNRVINLAEKASSNKVNEEILVEDEEIKLDEAFKEIEDGVLDFLNNKEYDKALEQFINLKGPIDNFFDHVLVMVEDEEIKENRLNLLSKISETMLMICDLSKLVK